MARAFFVRLETPFLCLFLSRFLGCNVLPAPYLRVVRIDTAMSISGTFSRRYLTFARPRTVSYGLQRANRENFLVPKAVSNVRRSVARSRAVNTWINSNTSLDFSERNEEGDGKRPAERVWTRSRKRLTVVYHWRDAVWTSRDSSDVPGIFVQDNNWRHCLQRTPFSARILSRRRSINSRLCRLFTNRRVKSIAVVLLCYRITCRNEARMICFETCDITIRVTKTTIG